MGSERCIRLRNHLERPPETVEVVDVKRAQVYLQRLEDIRQLYALTFHFDSVDVDVQLRHVHLVAAEHASKRGVRRRLLHDVLYRCIERVTAAVAAIFDL